ncbi:MAG TPA: ABC transporter permease [Candidatus Brocadiia bacterium]|nr:ABC transporter permease [Candidatus Brocadiia bacterium]
MRQTLLICKRGLGSLFRSPLGYIVITLFLFCCGLIFSAIVLQQSLSIQTFRDPNQPLAVNKAYWGACGMVMLFVMPLVSMSSIAGEKTSRTLELLLTSPLRLGHIILGKYLALMVFFVIMIAPTGVYFVFLRVYGGLALRQVFCAYLAALLLGSCLAAFGVFISALTRNMIIAAFATFIGGFIFWVAEAAANYLPSYGRVAASYLSLYIHFTDMAAGRVGLDDLAFFITFTIFFLLATRIAIRLLWVKGKWA